MIEGTSGGSVEDIAPSPATSASPGARVVLAETPWCVECKRMAPLVETVAAAHPGLLLQRVDVSTDPTRARELRVMATPTLIGLVGDSEVGRLTGRRGREDLEDFFAATESGIHPPSRASRTEAALQIAAGALLVVLGVLAGPSWPLLGLGTVLSGYGLLGLLLRGR